MKKSILNFGKGLSKADQKKVFGGSSITPGDEQYKHLKAVGMQGSPYNACLGLDQSGYWNPSNTTVNWCYSWEVDCECE